MKERYPRDEFDAVSVSREGRRGAHRARRSLASVLLPQVAAALVVVAAGAAAVTVAREAASPASRGSAAAQSASGLPAGTSLGQSVAASSPPTSSAATPSMGQASAPSASTPSSASSTPPPVLATSATPSRPGPSGSSASAAPSARASASAGVQYRGVSVVVLNAGHTVGAAAKAASTLTSAGWTVASTGNTSTVVRSTVVEYSDDHLAATAAAVAARVKGTVLESAATAPGTIKVILAD